MKHRCPNCAFEFDDSGRVTSKPRAEKLPPPEAQAILDAYAALTGTHFRVVPSDISRQAAMFAAHFTCEDLDRVVAYITHGIRAETGFNAQSLTWSKLMGDAIRGFLHFQDLLGAANGSLKRREFRFVPKYTGNTPIAKPAKPAIVPPGNGSVPPAPDPETDRIAATTADALAALRRTL